MKFIKEKYTYFVILCIIVLFALMRIFTTYGVNMGLADTVAQYLQSERIYKGDVPYRDFNMVTTPLYYYLSSISLLFSNTFISKLLLDDIFMIFYHIVFFKIADKMIDSKIKVFIFVFFNICICGFGAAYNSMCLTWMLCVFYLRSFYEQNRKTLLLTGVFVALCLMTKQTVGGVLLVLTIFDIVYLSYKNKEKILYNICYYSIGLAFIGIPYILYLLITHSFLDFFNYCLFGLIMFKSNKYVNIIGVMFTIFIIINIVLFIYHTYINKAISVNTIRYVIYLLLAYLLAIPINDFFHITLCYSMSLLLLFYIDYNTIIKFIYAIVNCIICIYYLLVYLGAVESTLERATKFLKFETFDEYIKPDIDLFEKEVKTIQQSYNMDVSVYSIYYALFSSYYHYSFDFVYKSNYMFLNGNLGTYIPTNIIEEDLNNNNIVIVDDLEYVDTDVYSQFPMEIYSWLDENAELIYSSDETGLNYYIKNKE